MKQTALVLASLLAAPIAAQTQAYLVDSNLDVLFSVNLSTGAATRIASTANNNLTTPADLTWRADKGELWTIDLSGGEVGTINTTTGVFTAVYQTNMSGWQGIAWDPTTSKFFLQNQSSNQIYTLDPATGMTTLLGSAGGALLTTLDVDAAGRLWSTEFLGASRIAQINKTTGVATFGAATISGLQGLGISSSGTWYGSSTNTDSLYTVNPSTGASTLVGAHGGGVVFGKGFDVVDSAAGFQDIPNTGCPNAGSVGRSSTNPTPGGSIILNCAATACSGGQKFLLIGARGPIGLPQPIACTSGCVLGVNPIQAASASAPITLPIPAFVPTGAKISFQCVCITTCATLSQAVEFTVQ